MNGGKLTYCLDDPYIHLAVAQGILDGTYGVNPGEVSSPSSSLLWPLLLVPFVAAGWGEVAPLLFNVVCGAATACVVTAGLRQALPRPGWWPLRVLLVLAVLLVSNAWGLAFTGMEHGLQLLLAVAVVHGLLRFAHGAPVPTFLAWATVLGPWVRYENLAVSGAAWLLLAWTGELRRALRWGGICVLGLALFSVFLVAQGLDWLPSSVRLKSGISSDGWGSPGSILSHLGLALKSGRGTALSFFGLGLLVFAGLRPSLDRVSKLALCLAGAGLLHLMFGTYGWFHRYEAYIFGSLGFATLALAPIVLPVFAERARAQAALAMALLVIAHPYIGSLPRIPTACNNVFEQQYQMHRFTDRFWKQPVAVNDLGYVAFGNDQYVLDLVGLASQEVQARRLTERAPVWLDDLTRRHGIDLALIYQGWFPRRPRSWIHVADLALSRDRVSAASATTSFFATNADAAPAIRAAVEAFRATLSKPERLSIIENESAPE